MCHLYEKKEDGKRMFVVVNWNIISVDRILQQVAASTFTWFDYVRLLNKEDIFNWRAKKKRRGTLKVTTDRKPKTDNFERRVKYEVI